MMQYRAVSRLLGHIASFRCDADFGRYRGTADIGEAVPIKPDL